MLLDGPNSAVQQEAVALIAAKHLDSFLIRLTQNTTLASLMKGIFVDPAGPAIISTLLLCT